MAVKINCRSEGGGREEGGRREGGGKEEGGRRGGGRVREEGAGRREESY